jgi:hypothetical protein
VLNLFSKSLNKTPRQTQFAYLQKGLPESVSIDDCDPGHAASPSGAKEMNDLPFVVEEYDAKPSHNINNNGEQSL